MRDICNRRRSLSFYECKDDTSNRVKGEEIMLDDFIRRVIQAAIESLPIDEEKKEDLLQSIVDQDETEDDQ